MIRVDDLEGAQLDLWVARAEGLENPRLATRSGYAPTQEDTIGCRVDDGLGFAFLPSTSWALGGPIIQREMIHLSPPTSRVHRHGGPNAGWGASGVWSACTWSAPRRAAWHPTDPLVAAMRCFVKSKFGDTVGGD